MKPHSLINLKRPHQKNKKNIFVVVIIIIFFLFIFKIIQQNILFDFFGLKNNVGLFFSNQKELQQENRLLKQELEKYKKLAPLNDYYYFENIELREKLNYQVDSEKIRKIFFVLQKGQDNIYDSYIISDPDKTLEKDDLVLAGFNFVIGKIQEIKSGQNQNLAKIKLFSAVGERNIFLLSDSEKNIKFDVEAVGEGGGILKVIVNREIEVSKNVVLKLIEDGEYLVAKLVEEQFKTQDPHRILLFQILINPYTLDTVEVEK